MENYMNNKLAEQVRDEVSEIQDPGGQGTIGKTGVLGVVQADQKGSVIVILEVAPVIGSALEPLRQEVERKAKSIQGVVKVNVILTAERKQGMEMPMPGAHNNNVNKYSLPENKTSANQKNIFKKILSGLNFDGQTQPKNIALETQGMERQSVPQIMDNIDPHKMAKNPVLDLPVKNIIVVASGKGGVGKSTVAANLAACLANYNQFKIGASSIQIGQSSQGDIGYKVGLLDADIYGPSQPEMMGDATYRPSLNKDKKLVPLSRYNMKIMSIGFMTDKKKALVWRGPMAQNAFYQMLRDVAWCDDDNQNDSSVTKENMLDFLIIDMPPGTGDIQLTLAQKISVRGAVIVSTPQDIALIDARRAVSMFETTQIPILGIVENMSTHICTSCGHEDYIFGHGGAKKEAENLSVPFLGALPLSRMVREDSDNGKPIVISHPQSDEAKAFINVTSQLLYALGL